MLNPGKKILALHDKKNKLVLSEKKILNETKNHNPRPLQVKWSVPYINDFNCFLIHWKLS